MVRLVLRKVAILGISALAGSIVVFLLLRVLGGDAATAILGSGSTPEARAALRAELGLDRPWHEQYVDWLAGIVTGDLGHSYANGFDIFDEIISRMGLTVSLAMATLFISWVIGLLLGIYAAFYAEKRRGIVVDIAAQLGIAVPSFWVALLLLTFVSVQLGWLPAGGYTPWMESPKEAAKSLLLPVFALSLTIASVNIRFVRSGMLEILNEDYIRTAMAKGLTRRRAAIRHGIRNAAIPLVTIGTLQLGALVSGAVVIEAVFTLPGWGRMLTSAVASRETLVVQSLAFVIILFILMLNFILDVTYGILDPRIRHAEGRARRL